MFLLEQFNIHYQNKFFKNIKSLKRTLLKKPFGDISHTRSQLDMSQPTISRDIHYLEKDLARSTKNYGQRLFSTFASTMMGYDDIIKKLWSIIDSKRTDDKERIQSNTLIALYYRQRIELIRSEPELLENKHYIKELQILNK